MKIHLALPFPPPNYGPSIYSINLRRSLEELGHDVVITNTEINRITTNIGKLSLTKYFKVIIVSLNILFKNISSHTFLNINLSAQGIVRSFIYFLCASVSSKKIYIIFHEGNIENFYKNYNPFIRKMFIKIISNSEKLLLLDEQQSESLKKYVEIDKLHVLGAYRNDLFNKETVKKNIIVFYSNLIEDKGARDAIEAFVGLEDRIKNNWEMVIAGNIKDPTFYNEIHSIYNSKVTFFTNKTYNEYLDLLNSSKVFIYPTKYKYEQQPAVIIEALMNKLVIVSYDWAGTKNMLPENYSFLCKNNVPELKKALTELINNTDIEFYMSKSRDFYLNNFAKTKFDKKLKNLF